MAHREYTESKGLLPILEKMMMDDARAPKDSRKLEWKCFVGTLLRLSMIEHEGSFVLNFYGLQCPD